MKKIFTVAQVKNENDIIESFCRYNLTYSDGMLILDNGSVDNTVEIILKLIDEGLPITLVKKDSVKLSGMTFKTQLAYKAFDEFDADLVLPLDADEFLYHVDGISPREMLESLHENVEYHIPWRTYVYTQEPDITLGFMPNNFSRYRNPILEELQDHAGKVPMSKLLAKTLQAQFTLGSHWLEYPEEHNDTVSVATVKELVISHFPLRSQTQVLFKTVTNSINKMKVIDNSLPFGEELRNHQLGILFKIFKDNGYINKEDLFSNSIEYSLFNKGDRLTISEQIQKYKDEITISQPMNVLYCADKLILRYTDYEKNPELLIRATLSDIDSTIMCLSSKNKQALLEMTHQNNILSQENNSLTQQFSTLAQHADNLSQQVNTLTQHADNLSQQVNTLTQHNNDLTQQVSIYTQQNYDLTRQVNSIAQQNDVLTQQLNILTQQTEQLESQISCIYNSRTYKIGNFFRKFYRFFIPYKK